jgi:hypothetical protein
MPTKSTIPEGADGGAIGHAGVMRERGQGPLEWLFRNRKTGRITIAQFPNAPLWLFLLAASLRWLFHPTGWSGTALRVLATAGLVWWAIDELVRGVNPWRRLLGGAVLAGQVVRFLG